MSLEKFVKNIVIGYINENFIPLEVPAEYSDLISDWKKININGKDFNFMRLKGVDENKFIIEVDNVGEIGSASLNCYDKNFNGCYLDNIRIDHKYRRIGLASKLYEYIEDLIGEKLKPSPIKQSPEIKKYWNKKSNLSESKSDYLSWKRKNVTLRGMKETTQDNGVYGSFGKGLYTAFLSNKQLAKGYGEVYFVVGGIPKHPKIVDGWNGAEIVRQNLVNDFCKKHGRNYYLKFFEDNTTMEDEMIKLGYDGLIIKGREMVNYKPENVKYFRTEQALQEYFENIM